MQMLDPSDKGAIGTSDVNFRISSKISHIIPRIYSYLRTEKRIFDIVSLISPVGRVFLRINCLNLVFIHISISEERVMCFKMGDLRRKTIKICCYLVTKPFLLFALDPHFLPRVMKNEFYHLRGVNNVKIQVILFSHQ